MEVLNNPVFVLLISGKRKSGKDYFSDRILDVCGEKDFVAIKISAPIKAHFASSGNLNFEELMGDGKYKETYRKEMIKWSEEARKKDPGIFCRSAIDLYCAHSKKVWIVSDVRRKSDIKWFKDTYGNRVKILRIEANNVVRQARGWTFEPEVDDTPSECDLDDFEEWDWKFENNGEGEKFKENLKMICDYMKESIQ